MRNVLAATFSAIALFLIASVWVGAEERDGAGLTNRLGIGIRAGTSLPLPATTDFESVFKQAGEAVIDESSPGAKEAPPGEFSPPIDLGVILQYGVLSFVALQGGADYISYSIDVSKIPGITTNVKGGISGTYIPITFGAMFYAPWGVSPYLAVGCGYVIGSFKLDVSAPLGENTASISIDKDYNPFEVHGALGLNAYDALFIPGLYMGSELMVRYFTSGFTEKKTVNVTIKAPAEAGGGDQKGTQLVEIDFPPAVVPALSFGIGYFF
ncbi:MAG: hypothetical protein ACUVXI_00905 [bacterium]